MIRRNSHRLFVGMLVVSVSVMTIPGVASAALHAGADRTSTPPPAAQAAPVAGPAVAAPTYVSLALDISVNRPADEVWKRIGKYCDIGEWLQMPCTITSGTDGELGAVRSVANEILVGRTQRSYTYTQPVRNDRPYNMYHGTLEVRPVTATTSSIVYVLVWDNSMLADDAARQADIARRRTTFTRALDNMKILAEGGTLPAKPGGLR